MSVLPLRWVNFHDATAVLATFASCSAVWAVRVDLAGAATDLEDDEAMPMVSDALVAVEVEGDNRGRTSQASVWGARGCPSRYYPRLA